MPMTRFCPALLICAPASGHGKTTVTAALARHHRSQGLRVRCFRIGSDLIDPAVLVQASGQPVYNLDPWVMGVEHCRELLHDAASNADLLLIEGEMGLFDGEPGRTPPAVLPGLPLMTVIDATGMAQTFGAVLHGLASWQPETEIAAVVANRIVSARHGELVGGSVADTVPLTLLPDSPSAGLPPRRLGLWLAAEIDDLDARLDRLAQAIAGTPAALLPPVVALESPAVEPVPRWLDGVTVAVAFDQAFCFLYQANLEWLQRMGARLQLFSPLADEVLPECDALYLPGGYPELYAARLAENTGMMAVIRAHVAADRPVLAECGGLLYLADALKDLDGDEYPMLGVLPATALMERYPMAPGPREVEIGGERIRGYSFHYSSLRTGLEPVCHARTAAGDAGEAVYLHGSVIASYIHWYFPSNPGLIADWLSPRED